VRAIAGTVIESLKMKPDDPELDDFLCERQADEGIPFYQPEDNSNLIPF